MARPLRSLFNVYGWLCCATSNRQASLVSERTFLMAALDNPLQSPCEKRGSSMDGSHNSVQSDSSPHSLANLPESRRFGKNPIREWFLYVVG